MIIVVDFKNFTWHLTPTKRYKTSRKGHLYKRILAEFEAPPMELSHYGIIPVPVFTEWWP